MSLKTKIEEDLITAIKAKETLKLSSLRMIKAAIKNKEIDLRKEVDDAQVISILSTFVKQRKESIEQFKKGGRSDLVKQEEAELAIVEAYLPKALSEAELEKLVEAAIQESGAQGAKDMGKVMKAVMAKTQGRADGKAVNALVNKKLKS